MYVYVYLNLAEDNLIDFSLRTIYFGKVPIPIIHCLTLCDIINYWKKWKSKERQLSMSRNMRIMVWVAVSGRNKCEEAAFSLYACKSILNIGTALCLKPEDLDDKWNVDKVREKWQRETAIRAEIKKEWESYLEIDTMK